MPNRIDEFSKILGEINKGQKNIEKEMLRNGEKLDSIERNVITNTIKMDAAHGRINDLEKDFSKIQSRLKPLEEVNMHIKWIWRAFIAMLATGFSALIGKVGGLF